MPQVRQVLVLAVCLAGVGVSARDLVAKFLSDPTFLPPTDFLSYWAAGRLLATGADPYDSDAVLPLQQANGLKDHTACLHWQPPWTLSICMPLGLMPARVAQLVWLTAQAVAVGLAAVRLWRVYGGPAHLWWVPLGLAAACPATFYLVAYGQFGGWLLVGLAGWLSACAGGRMWAAGLVALCAFKPHLFGPLWVVVVVEAMRHRSAAVRLGVGVLAGLGCAAAVTLVNPDVWANYLAALRRPPSDSHQPLSGIAPPVVGFWLRHLLAPGQVWVQFLPAAAAGTLTAGYWWGRRHRWDWAAELPRLVLLGAFAAPYSGWPFDLTVLLVPVIVVAARLARTGDGRTAAWLGVGYLVVAAVAVGQIFVIQSLSYHVWVTPAVAGLYWMGSR